MQAQQPISAAVSPLDYEGAGSGRKSRLDPIALATHLAGWFLVLGVVRVVGIFVIPRFEQVYANYVVGLPEATRRVLWFSRAERDWPFRLPLIALGLAHSIAAAWWCRRATEVQKLVYRLALMLLLAGALLYVVAGLCMPLVNTLSGVAPPPATAPAPATSGPAQ
jgi:hypothetical protein